MNNHGNDTEQPNCATQIVEKQQQQEKQNMIDEAISVSVRVRPLNSKEKKAKSKNSWRVIENKSITDEQQQQQHTFDNVFDTKTTTATVYNKVARGLVSSVLCGMNGTVFAYGQTASGKTFTMQGEPSSPGILELAGRQVFDEIANKPHMQFLLHVSYIEIFNEQVKDLLSDSNTNLRIREDRDKGFFVDNLQMKPIMSVEQLLQTKEEGETRRHVGETNMNMRSSRSHTIFSLKVEMRDTRGMQEDDDNDDIEQESENVDTSNKKRKSVDKDVQFGVLSGNLNLVDLAGSENAKATGAEGGRLKEGGNINKSLLTLSRVISQLANSKGKTGFINWRDSKLTQILQPSLAGNCRTAIVCCITPASKYMEETKSTLNFASRAKQIRTRAIVNEVLDGQSEMKKLKHKIHALQEELASQQDLNAEKLALESKIKQLTEFVRNGGPSLIAPSGDLNADSAAELARTTKRKRKKRETWCPGDFPQPSSSSSSPPPLRGSESQIDSIQEENEFESNDDTGTLSIPSPAATQGKSKKSRSSASSSSSFDQSQNDNQHQPIFASERIAALQTKVKQQKANIKQLEENDVKMKALLASAEDKSQSCEQKSIDLEAKLESERQLYAESKAKIRDLLQSRENECSDQKEEIKRLNEKLEKTENNASQYERTIKQLKEDEQALLETVASEQAKAREALLGKEQEMKEVESKFQDAQAEMNHKSTVIEELEQKLKFVNENVESVSSLTNQQVTTLTAEKEQLVAKISQMEQVLVETEIEKDRCAAIRETVEELQTLVGVSTKDQLVSFVSELLEEQVQHRASIAELKDASDKAEKEHVARITELQEQIEQHQKQLDANQTEFEKKLEEAAGDYEKRSVEREAEYEAKIAELHSTVEQHQEELQESRSDAAQHLEKVAELTGALAELEQKTSESAAEFQAEKNQYESQICVMRSTIDAQVAELKSELENDAAMSEELAEKNARIAELQSEHADYKEIVESLEMQLNIPQDFLVCQLVESNRSFVEMKEQFAEQKDQLEQLGNKITESENCCNQLEEQLSERNAAYVEQSDRIERLEESHGNAIHEQVRSVMDHLVLSVELDQVSAQVDEYREIVLKYQSERSVATIENDPEQLKRISQLESQLALVSQELETVTAAKAEIESELSRVSSESSNKLETEEQRVSEMESHLARANAVNCDLTTKVQELEKQVKSLQESNEEIVENHQNAMRSALGEVGQDATDAAAKKVQQLELRVNLAVQEREKAEANVQDLQNTIKDLQAMANDDVDHLKKALEQKEVELKQASSEKGRLGAQLQEAKDELAKKIADLGQKECEFERHYAAQNDWFEDKISELEGEIAELKDGGGFDSSEDALKCSIQALEKKVGSLKESVAEKEDCISRMQEALDAKEEELFQLQQQSSSQGSRAQDVEPPVGHEELEKELNQAKEDIQELRSRLKHQKESHNLINQELLSQQTRVAEFENKLEEKERKMQDLSASLTQVEAENAGLKEHNDRLKSIEDELESARKLLADKANEEPKVSNREAHLEKQNAKLVEEVTAMHLQLVEAQGSAKSNASQIKKLEEELAKSKQRVQRLELVKITKEKAAKITQMKEDHRKLKIRFAEVSASNESLKVSLKNLGEKLQQTQALPCSACSDLMSLVGSTARRFGVLEQVRPREFIGMLADRLQNVQSERDSYYAEVRAMEEHDNDTANMKVSALTEILDKYKAKLLQSEECRQEAIHDAQKISKELQTVKSNSSQEIRCLQDESVKLRERLSEFEEDYLKSQEESKKLAADITAELEDAKGNVRFLEKENLDLMVELRKLRDLSNNPASSSSSSSSSSSISIPLSPSTNTETRKVASTTPFANIDCNRREVESSSSSSLRPDKKPKSVSKRAPVSDKENSLSSNQKSVNEEEAMAGLDDNATECKQQ